MLPVFGGNPLLFSLVEFGEVTGLPCGEFKIIFCTHVHENVMYRYTVMSAFRLVAITQSCTPQHVHPYIMYNV